MPGRVVGFDEIEQELRAHRARGQRVVLTNGVFDLLHVGHLRSLRAARALGDVLVVGVNDDASVRGLKPGRPLVGAAERAELLAALEPVDYVVIFPQATAEALIDTVRPDVYAKGGDYAEETLPEAAAARRVGARVAILPLVPGRSTSGLVSRLARLAEVEAEDPPTG